MPRILLIEDEESLRQALRLNLELEGMEVVDKGDGRQLLDLISRQHFDLLILDVMLPDVDGFTLCEQVRVHNQKMPILMLTAKGDSADRITGLRKGADDYLTKPFHLEELLLRIRGLLRRSGASPDELDVFEFGPNRIDFKSHEAQGIRGDVFLTKKEALLLRLLIERKNEVVSRQEILQVVWCYDVYPSTRTIDNFIMNFRKHFEADPKHPVYFISVRGVGYKFSL
jgi:two-component system, OmpR family, alkaline phosphatase synthesis response regulator PhoP